MAPPTPEMPRTGVTILFVNTALQKTHRTVLAKCTLRSEQPWMLKTIWLLTLKMPVVNLNTL
jgi:hypothetical protein